MTSQRYDARGAADTLCALFDAFPVDHPDRPSIRRAIEVLRDTADADRDVITLNRPPNVSDEEWRDMIGFARITVALKAAGVTLEQRGEV